MPTAAKPKLASILALYVFMISTPVCAVEIEPVVRLDVLGGQFFFERQGRMQGGDGHTLALFGGLGHLGGDSGVV